jgi:hypothetical protein
MEYFWMIFNCLRRSVRHLLIHINICNIFHHLLVKLSDIFYGANRATINLHEGMLPFVLCNEDITLLEPCIAFVMVIFSMFDHRVIICSNMECRTIISAPTLACCSLWKYIHETRDILLRQYSSFILTWIHICQKTFLHYNLSMFCISVCPHISGITALKEFCWIIIHWLRLPSAIAFAYLGKGNGTCGNKSGWLNVTITQLCLYMLPCFVRGIWNAICTPQVFRFGCNF